MKSYNKGLHLLATLQTKETGRLMKSEDFKVFLSSVIHQLGLHHLGEVYHNFNPAGFTGVVCLSESHISIHTWPEHGLLNIDVYLSNHLQVNEEKVKTIFEEIKTFFVATAISVNEVTR